MINQLSKVNAVQTSDASNLVKKQTVTQKLMKFKENY